MATITLELTILSIAFTFLGGLVGGIFVAALFQEQSVIKIRKFTLELNWTISVVCGYVLFFILVVTSYPLFFVRFETNPDFFLYFLGLYFGIFGSFFGNVFISMLFRHPQEGITIGSGEIIGNVRSFRWNRKTLLIFSSVILMLMALSLCLFYFGVSSFDVQNQVPIETKTMLDEIATTIITSIGTNIDIFNTLSTLVLVPSQRRIVAIVHRVTLF